MIKCMINTNVSLYIEDDILASMKKHYCTNEPKEGGGILLGKVSIDEKNIYITELYQIESSKSDNTHYERNATVAQEIINNRWKASSGVINYLGEWHTHPKMIAVPSNTDINSMKLISKSIQAVIPYIFLIILGENNEFSISIVEKSMRGEVKCIHIQ